MITVYKEWDVICDYCSSDYGYDTMYTWDTMRAIQEDKIQYKGHISEEGLREIRDNAKKDHWLYENGKDICPNCQRKIAQGEIKTHE